jgi:hypothetical protein
MEIVEPDFASPRPHLAIRASALNRMVVAVMQTRRLGQQWKSVHCAPSALGGHSLVRLFVIAGGQKGGPTASDLRPRWRRSLH